MGTTIDKCCFSERKSNAEDENKKNEQNNNNNNNINNNRDIFETKDEDEYFENFIIKTENETVYEESKHNVTPELNIQNSLENSKENEIVLKEIETNNNNIQPENIQKLNEKIDKISERNSPNKNKFLLKLEKLKEMSAKSSPNNSKRSSLKSKFSVKDSFESDKNSLELEVFIYGSYEKNENSKNIMCLNCNREQFFEEKDKANYFQCWKCNKIFKFFLNENKNFNLMKLDKGHKYYKPTTTSITKKPKNLEIDLNARPCLFFSDTE